MNLLDINMYMSRHVITESFIKEVREFYLSFPMTLDHLCKHFDICIPTAMKILKGIKRYNKSLIYNPELKENFFENIDTERKAYWIGLLISDGNIFNPENSKHRGQKWVSITLQDEDRYILEEFRKDVGLKSIVGNDGRGSSYVAVRSNIMANSLLKYDLKERKSFDTKFPFNIGESYYRHVIRGIIDGDGSIQAYPYVTKDGRNKFRHSISCCGTNRLMQDMVSVICNQLQLKTVPSVYDYKNRKLSEFKVSNIEDLKKVGDWLYTDATIFLKRKKFNYDLILDHYRLNA